MNKPRDMRAFILVISLGLMFPGAVAAPTEMSAADSVKYLENGGLLSYDLDITRCVSNLPKMIPVYSWGDRVSDVMFFNQGSNNFELEFSITRAINGSRFNMTDRPLRFTQVSFLPSGVFVEITDVNEDIPQFLQTGSINCNYNKKGVTLYGRSKPGEELTSLDNLLSHLRKGYDINYVLNWDKCSPSSSTTNMWWAGRISGYRLSHSGGVTFTQLIDSAQSEFFMEATVSQMGVTVKTFNVNRLARKQSSTETKNCTLGEAYRLFVNSNA